MSRVKKAIEKAKASRQAHLSAHSTEQATVKIFRRADTFDDSEQVLLTPEQRAKHFIIHPEMKDSSIEDSIMAIRAAILRRSADTPCNILVMPAFGSSGNRFISLNLAAAFASDTNMSSILINCNFKRASNAYRDLSKSSFGLSDYLSHEAQDVRKLLQPIGIERLRLIDAGTNVQQQRTFLTSVRFQQIVGSLREFYPGPYIVFDAPPVAESANTRVLIDECDLVVLVADYGESSEQSVEGSIERIGKEKLLGVVLNNEPKWPFSTATK